MKILVVDDDIDTRLLLQTLLQGLGYAHVLVADSAVNAFQALGSENGESPGSDEIGLIFMDINMPGIDGIEACRMIRSELFPDVPIIMVTGIADTEHVAKAIDAGATDYIRKPVEKRQLQARVQSAISSKRKQQLTAS